MKKIFPFFAIIFVCFLAYTSSLKNQFLLDDHYVLFGKDGVQNLESAASLFSTPRDGFFRPVGYGLLRACYLLFGENPFLYHFFNLLLFAGLCILILIFVLELTGNQRLALLTSVIYALHPINQAIVNFASFSSMVTYPYFMLLAMIFTLKFLDSRQKTTHFLVLLFLFSALLSHEMAVFFPVYLILVAWLGKKGSKKEVLALCISSALLICAFLFWRASLSNPRPVTTVFELGISAGVYFTVIAKLVFWYISKLFYPDKILFIWDVPLASGAAAGWIFALFAALGLVLFFINYWRGKNRILSLSLAVFLAGFLPLGLAGFVYSDFTKTAIIEPHWFYFSSVGFFILAATALLKLEGYLNKSLRFIPVLMICGFLLVSAWRHNKLWKDEETYCAFWMATNPYNETAKVNRAYAYLGRNDHGLDQSRYTNCTEPALLAGSFNIVGKARKAEEYFDLSLSMDPACTAAYYGLSVHYMDENDLKKAEDAIKKAIALDAQAGYFYEQLALIYEKQGKTKDAAELRRQLKP